MSPADLGRDAARRRAAKPLPLNDRPSYRATRAAAPLLAHLDAAGVAAYRTAYADALVQLGAARAPGERVRYEHKHPKRSLRIPDDEWAEWQDRARAAGDSVNQWVLDTMRRAMR